MGLLQCPVQGQGLDLMILVGSFQLLIFHDSMSSWKDQGEKRKCWEQQERWRAGCCGMGSERWSVCPQQHSPGMASLISWMSCAAARGQQCPASPGTGWGGWHMLTVHVDLAGALGHVLGNAVCDLSAQ